MSKLFVDFEVERCEAFESMQDASYALNWEVFLFVLNLVVDFDVLTASLEIRAEQELGPEVKWLFSTFPISKISLLT